MTLDYFISAFIMAVPLTLLPVFIVGGLLNIIKRLKWI